MFEVCKFDHLVRSLYFSQAGYISYYNHLAGIFQGLKIQIQTFLILCFSFNLLTIANTFRIYF